MARSMKLEGCVNCGVCMQVCSLHHTGIFSYRNASITIQQEGDGFQVSYRTPFSCDTCEGEGSGNYQCVKYCYRAKDALREFILTQGGASK